MIQKLRSASNVVGEIPTLFKVKNEYNWPKKKDAILEHCVQEMDGKDNKNLVVLYDSDHSGFKDVDIDLKRLIKDKIVVESVHCGIVCAHFLASFFTVPRLVAVCRPGTLFQILANRLEGKALKPGTGG